MSKNGQGSGYAVSSKCLGGGRMLSGEGEIADKSSEDEQLQ